MFVPIGTAYSKLSIAIEVHCKKIDYKSTRLVVALLYILKLRQNMYIAGVSRAMLLLALVLSLGLVNGLSGHEEKDGISQLNTSSSIPKIPRGNHGLAEDVQTRNTTSFDKQLVQSNTSGDSGGKGRGGRARRAVG